MTQKQPPVTQELSDDLFGDEDRHSTETDIKPVADHEEKPGLKVKLPPPDDQTPETGNDAQETTRRPQSRNLKIPKATSDDHPLPASATTQPAHRSPQNDQPPERVVQRKPEAEKTLAEKETEVSAPPQTQTVALPASPPESENTSLGVQEKDPVMEDHTMLSLDQNNFASQRDKAAKIYGWILVILLGIGSVWVWYTQIHLPNQADNKAARSMKPESPRKKQAGNQQEPPKRQLVQAGLTESSTQAVRSPKVAKPKPEAQFEVIQKKDLKIFEKQDELFRSLKANGYKPRFSNKFLIGLLGNRQCNPQKGLLYREKRKSKGDTTEVLPCEAMLYVLSQEQWWPSLKYMTTVWTFNTKNGPLYVYVKSNKFFYITYMKPDWKKATYLWPYLKRP